TASACDVPSSAVVYVAAADGHRWDFLSCSEHLVPIHAPTCPDIFAPIGPLTLRCPTQFHLRCLILLRERGPLRLWEACHWHRKPNPGRPHLRVLPVPPYLVHGDR